MRKIGHAYSLVLAGVLLAGVSVLSCGGPSKIRNVQEKQLSAQLVLPQESDIPELEFRQSKSDTVVVKDESGKDVLIMKAIRDEESGEMVATDVLQAAIVTARFRNIAERRGKIDLPTCSSSGTPPGWSPS